MPDRTNDRRVQSFCPSLGPQHRRALLRPPACRLAPSMTDRIALLRGINVGRAKRIAMADLRSLIKDLGHTKIRTLLNSGNACFKPMTAIATRKSLPRCKQPSAASLALKFQSWCCPTMSCTSSSKKIRCRPAAIHRDFWWLLRTTPRYLSRPRRYSRSVGSRKRWRWEARPPSFGVPMGSSSQALRRHFHARPATQRLFETGPPCSNCSKQRERTDSFTLMAVEGRAMSGTIARKDPEAIKQITDHLDQKEQAKSPHVDSQGSCSTLTRAV